MALPNPIYIDENALHSPSVIRLLAYGLTSGVQGVIGQTDCAVKALGTPGAAVQAMPGAYMIRAKHLGGSYEGYGGKYTAAETSPTISATTSSGGRSDLVVLEIRNPYVEGSGSWDPPADLVNGPYIYLKVIEGVPNTTWDITQYDATREAITLARIDRPASTGIVQQNHITDLRSLAQLGGTRTVIEQTTVPPIAQQVYAASTHCNNNDQLNFNDLSWKDWPTQATWQVPVPDWAGAVSVMMTGTPASAASAWGELRLNFAGTALSPREFDINNAPDGAINVYRANIPYGGVYTVPSAARGHVVTVKVQAHSNAGTTATRMLIADKTDVDGSASCYFDLWLLFQRVPDPG